MTQDSSPKTAADIEAENRGADHLDLLEAHAIFIIREVAAECERPVLLFSGGKDSAVLLHLAVKAFKPAALPFPIMHVDTGHNFPEVISYRDDIVAQLNERLIVASVEESIARGRVVEDASGMRKRLQTTTLLDAIQEHGFDAALGGAWDPRRQRPELWQLYQGKVSPGEHLRAFPLSDWTELDIWQYIQREAIALPTIYFAHQREVFERNGMLLAVSQWVSPEDDEIVRTETVRFRTVGDATCTGAVLSDAAGLAQIITETALARVSERGATRADDKFSE
ncbi:MAG: sulfate adenylyltransferase subunit 2, partial [Actinobacteria bacterium]|nr:sulfate adenylyltransferase subunit 2 [Actinomycetota bacterium]